MRSILRKIKSIIRKTLTFPVQAYYTVAGSQFECNICHYKTNRFDSDSWHEFSICPRCRSQVRHRLLWAALMKLPDFSAEKILRNKSILHFAPEVLLGKQFKKLTHQYKTADFFTEGYHYDNIDYNLDMSNMKVIADHSIDCLVALDVLEHIPDHKKAMREIYRVLKKDGVCILTVPQKDSLDVTEEDLSLNDPKEREKRFGQFDH